MEKAAADRLNPDRNRWLFRLSSGHRSQTPKKTNDGRLSPRSQESCNDPGDFRPTCAAGIAGTTAARVIGLLRALQTSSEECVMMPTNEPVGASLTAPSLLIGPKPPAATAAEDHLMDPVDQKFGKAQAQYAGGSLPRWLHPRRLSNRGRIQDHRLLWRADRARHESPHVRRCQADLEHKWLNALAGTWWDLAPEELGGVRFDGQSIIYALKEQVAAQGYTRAAFTNISKTHFTWRGEKSDDGKAWSEFMVVECYRHKE